MKSFSDVSSQYLSSDTDRCSSDDAPAYRLYRARHIDGRERSASLYEDIGEPEVDSQERYRHRVIRWKIPWAVAILLCIILAVCSVLAFFSSSRHESSIDEKEVSSSEVYSSVEEPLASVHSSGSAPSVWVHVVGAVKSPGLYELPDQSRVADAISAAQGLVDDANPDSINLASKITDGQQVRVLFQGQSVDAVQGVSPQNHQTGDVVGSLVNINTASAQELETLPRVGPATAQKIIEFRQAHGGFRDVDELESVSGIGPALLERLRPLVRV
ncbi:helix-hairpin-helix domain-containing protein [Rothia sp. P13129]|uniref:helix-hairpin-helix domain-containing protein n=1 Tax=Rothia sp. P13129 TaxID=3402664 RepID=UPI003AD6DE9D